eukprot:11179224-Lingulodinium_polyedra.AAC.1
MPCQKLTMAGARRGELGLAGGVSVICLAPPVVARAAAEIRADLLAHVLCESAGSARRPHQIAMAA